MGDYHIRKYNDEDYKMVRDIFARGIMEYIFPLTKYSLNLPRSRLFLLTVPLAVFVVFKSFLYCLAVTALYVALLWYGSRRILMAVFYLYLDGDMKDIQQYYMRKRGACFWVAEYNGKVVGIVGAEQHQNSNNGKKLQLKHLHVSKDHRKKGIAKALCHTVISFAKKGGYESVVLETSVMQYMAVKLYERMGFTRTNSYVLPHFFGIMLHFVMVDFNYDIVQHN